MSYFALPKLCYLITSYVEEEVILTTCNSAVFI